MKRTIFEKPIEGSKCSVDLVKIITSKDGLPLVEDSVPTWLRITVDNKHDKNKNHYEVLIDCDHLNDWITKTSDLKVTHVPHEDHFIDTPAVKVRIL